MEECVSFIKLYYTHKVLIMYETKSWALYVIFYK